MFALLRSRLRASAIAPTLGTIPLGITVMATGLAGLAGYALLYGGVVLIAHFIYGR